MRIYHENEGIASPAYFHEGLVSAQRSYLREVPSGLHARRDFTTQPGCKERTQYVNRNVTNSPQCLSHDFCSLSIPGASPKGLLAFRLIR